MPPWITESDGRGSTDARRSPATAQPAAATVPLVFAQNVASPVLNQLATCPEGPLEPSRATKEGDDEQRTWSCSSDEWCTRSLVPRQVCCEKTTPKAHPPRVSCAMAKCPWRALRRPKRHVRLSHTREQEPNQDDQGHYGSVEGRQRSREEDGAEGDLVGIDRSGALVEIQLGLRLRQDPLVGPAK